MKTRIRARRALLATCAVALAVPAAASADPTIARLRVEADGRALSPGVSYVTDTTRIGYGANGSCGNRGGRETYSGPTALGLLADAGLTNHRLRPLQTIRYDIGLFLCGVDRHVARPDFSSYWSNKVNYVSSMVVCSLWLYRVDEVLWLRV